MRNSLRRLAVEAVPIADKEVRTWAQDTRKALKATPYPPQRPGQTYKRTGRLANSFAVKKQGPAVYTLVNSAEYASFVIGENQAWMHKGRWYQFLEEVNKRTPALVKNLTKALLGVFRGD